MENKSPSLGERIIQAATDEFMEYGFREASMRKISGRAGLTTGALYNRYRNKDVLFTSLVQCAWQEIADHLREMEDSYLQVQKCPGLDGFLEAIRQEEQLYLTLLFEHYDACVLAICRSDGSSVQKKLEQMMKKKAKQTADFFQTIGTGSVDYDAVEVLIEGQFHCYQKIIDKGYDRQKAVSCMKTVDRFVEAGWRSLFQQITG